MKLPVWVHNVTSAYPGNGGLPVDDILNPFSAVYGKTNDGLRFQATWDTHPAAIDSLRAVVEAETNIYRPQGIDYVPWGVVHGRWENSSEYVVREGRLAAQIAMAARLGTDAPIYIVDLEPHYHAPFPAFWRDDLGAGPREVAEFVEAFRATAGAGAELWLAVDAREPHLEPVSFGAWIGHDAVTRVLPMVYFTDFVRPQIAQTMDALTATRNAITLLGTNGVLPGAIYPIFPGDALAPILEYAVEAAEEDGCGGVSIWQRGNLSLAAADAVAAMEDPWEAGPAEPPVDHSATIVRLNEIEGRVASARAELGLINEIVRKVRRDFER